MDFQRLHKSSSKYLGYEQNIGEDKINRCKIFLSEDIVLTVPKKSRPFQGWRYLKNNDIPKDDVLYDPLSYDKSNEELISELSKLGLV